MALCPREQGSDVRPAIKLATSQMFGTFGNTIHCAFIYAVMIGVWTSDASPMAHVIVDLLVAYMSVEHSDLQTFLDGAKETHSLTCVSADFDVPWDTLSISKSQGWLRLNSESNHHFAKHWKFLWKCVCRVMCRRAAPLCPADVLVHISEKTFTSQGAEESVPSFFARLRRSYSFVRGELKAMKNGKLTF